ncbi:MAG: carbonic anhydrase family protein [Longimicrobiales bacterium]
MPTLDTRPTDTLAPTPAVDRRAFAGMLGASALGLGLAGCAPGEEAADPQAAAGMAPTGRTLTQASQESLTPADSLALLQEGNRRFVAAQGLGRAYTQQVRATASGQYPHAVVLGCIDSRVPLETVFDQGIGDIFGARVAGNIVNEDMLGSMEFACAVAGSKSVVVLGHTACGAVKGAIGEVRLGNLTALVEKIEPAVQSVDGARNADDGAYVDRVAAANVGLVLDEIRERSPLLAGMEAEGRIVLAGAMYDIATGEVRFLQG